MNLRTISISLSSIVLIGVVGFYASALAHFNELLSVDGAFFLLFLVLFNGSPPIISIVVSVCSKHSTSHVLPAMVSLLYGFYFICLAAYVVESVNIGHHFGKSILMVGLASLFFSPLWLIAIIIEICHRYKERREPESPSAS